MRKKQSWKSTDMPANVGTNINESRLLRASHSRNTASIRTPSYRPACSYCLAYPMPMHLCV